MKKNKFLAMMLAVGMAASLIACGNLAATAEVPKVRRKVKQKK